jgi:hypothetical protein
VYSMTTKTSMLVKCEKCGYENFPQHRFCGMCAAPLPLPTPPGMRPNPELRTPAPRPISRPVPSPVDREPSSARNLSYLLEDEPAPSHRGKYFLALVLLLVALGVVGWHWRGDWSALAGRFSSSAQPSSSTVAPSDSSAPVGVNAGTTQPSAGVGEQRPAAQSSPATAAAAPPAAGAADSTPTDQTQAANPTQQDDSAAATTDDSATAPPPAVRKAPKVRAQPATPPAAPAAELEAEGEKYLYGNGVPENCTRARTNLLAAAQHSNSQAENVLGTMYATGHCATRDLPTAYRWFSRSLRKDPTNTRIEQDLKVLWNQMTPEERQLALRDAR